MEYIFRNKLLLNEKFNENFNNLVKSGRIVEIPDDIWSIIEEDKSSIKIDGNDVSFAQILKEGLSEGRCYQCSTNLALLLHLYDYEVKQVIGKNHYFKGTTGSPNGGHYWLEVKYGDDWYILDTSLLCMIKKYSAYSLGYEGIKNIKAEDMLLDGNYYSIYLGLKNRKDNIRR